MGTQSNIFSEIAAARGNRAALEALEGRSMGDNARKLLAKLLTEAGSAAPAASTAPAPAATAPAATASTTPAATTPAATAPAATTPAPAASTAPAPAASTAPAPAASTAPAPAGSSDTSGRPPTSLTGIGTGVWRTDGLSQDDIARRRQLQDRLAYERAILAMQESVRIAAENRAEMRKGWTSDPLAAAPGMKGVLNVTVNESVGNSGIQYVSFKKGGPTTGLYFDPFSDSALSSKVAPYPSDVEIDPPADLPPSHLKSGSVVISDSDSGEALLPRRKIPEPGTVLIKFAGGTTDEQDSKPSTGRSPGPTDKTNTNQTEGKTASQGTGSEPFRDSLGFSSMDCDPDWWKSEYKSTESAKKSPRWWESAKGADKGPRWWKPGETEQQREERRKEEEEEQKKAWRENLERTRQLMLDREDGKKWWKRLL